MAPGQDSEERTEASGFDTMTKIKSRCHTIPGAGGKTRYHHSLLHTASLSAAPEPRVVLNSGHGAHLILIQADLALLALILLKVGGIGVGPVVAVGLILEIILIMTVLVLPFRRWFPWGVSGQRLG
jgi:hypothetical protein